MCHLKKLQTSEAISCNLGVLAASEKGIESLCKVYFTKAVLWFDSLGKKSGTIG